MSQEFDVLVIGAGPGGYVAAIRSAQLGLRVACVDAWQNAAGGPAPGGTCTNVGCIPSKALLQSSEYFEHAREHFAEHGISCGKLGMDVGQMLARKDSVVRQNNDGILYLFKKNKVTFFHGRAAFAGRSGEAYAVEINAGAEKISARHVIVATGSSARALPQVPFDEETVLSNDGALRLPRAPKTLALIGGGVIGLELGSVWRRLGAQVTVLEGLPEFLPAVDGQIAREAQKLFTRQGLKIELGVQIGSIKTGKKGATIQYTDAQGATQTLAAEKVVVSIGRVPHTEGLNAQAIGLQLEANGAVAVDAQCRTNCPNVWAVGDVVRGPMLAHKAEEEGVAVAERIAGQHGHVNFETLPSVIYTHPEIAWVGRNEQQLKAQGVAYRAGVFPFKANGRARALGDSDGMVKFLADAQSDEILGVHIIGPQASELIAEAVVAMEFKASSEDIARICHAHPSLSEASKEAALAVDKRALNY